MGVLEKEVSKKIRNSKIQSAILRTVGTAGLLSVALLAPNALRLFKISKSNSRAFLRNKKHSINNSRNRLIKNGFIKYNKDGFLMLTKLGEKELRKIEGSNYSVIKPRRWDGKWRILTFDIKENKKSLRDQIRRVLVLIGFVKLQNSVWIFPYDCEDMITLLKADFEIGKDLLYIIAEKVENDQQIKNIFGLS